jgi:hypothetical protein
MVDPTAAILVDAAKLMARLTEIHHQHCCVLCQDLKHHLLLYMHSMDYGGWEPDYCH